MPNTFVYRCFIQGSPNDIKKILKKHFYWDEKQKRMRTRGLSENKVDEPMDDGIVNSGEFEKDNNEIRFSDYAGWSLPVEYLQFLARQFPKSVRVKVVGFDMDNYPDQMGAQVLELEGKTGNILQSQETESSEIAKLYFPTLYRELQKEVEKYKREVKSQKITFEHEKEGEQRSLTIPSNFFNQKWALRRKQLVAWDEIYGGEYLYELLRNQSSKKKVHDAKWLVNWSASPVITGGCSKEGGATIHYEWDSGNIASPPQAAVGTTIDTHDPLRVYESKYPWFFRKAYIPILSKQKQLGNENENIGMDPTFFDNQPGFDRWPGFKNEQGTMIPGVFLMQFVDPRDMKKEFMLQVFVPPLEYVDEHKALVRHLPLKWFETKKIVRRKEPSGLKTLEKPVADQKGWITKWKIVNEPAFQSTEKWDKLAKEASPKDFKFLEQYQKEQWKPYENVKLGGWGVTAQWEPYKAWISNVYFLQYLDGGTIHIFPDRTMGGDTY